MQDNSNRRRHRIIISGGGTGGHIFPAIAIANALKKKEPDVEILFIGAKGKMEMQKVPAAGYPIEALWISGLQRKLTIRNLFFPLKVLLSLMKAKKIIKRFKPDIVVGVGGYASGPTLRVTSNRGIPTVIQEQNSFPGITNKLLAKKVKRICVAYEGMEKFFPKEKIILTGNPVRQEVIETTGKKRDALALFGLEPDKKILLIIGGSQGALSINKSIQKNLDFIVQNDIQVIWQTGNYYYPTAIELSGNPASKGIRIVEFIDRMDLAYAAADVIVSRAGAIAISEICAVGIPAVFIPLPSAAEDHQTKNAQALTEKDAAILIPDNEANEKLAITVVNLMKDETKRKKLSENIARLAIRDAADRIAITILKLCN